MWRKKNANTIWHLNIQTTRPVTITALLSNRATMPGNCQSTISTTSITAWLGGQFFGSTKKCSKIVLLLMVQKSQTTTWDGAKTLWMGYTINLNWLTGLLPSTVVLEKGEDLKTQGLMNVLPCLGGRVEQPWRSCAVFLILFGQQFPIPKFWPSWKDSGDIFGNTGNTGPNCRGEKVWNTWLKNNKCL